MTYNFTGITDDQMREAIRHLEMMITERELYSAQDRKQIADYEAELSARAQKASTHRNRKAPRGSEALFVRKGENNRD